MIHRRRRRNRRVTHNAFSIRRIWDSLLGDEIRPTEIGLALFFFLVRGTYLIHYGTRHPGVEVFLRSMGLNELRVGVLCWIAAALHLYSAGTNYQWWRIGASIWGVALSLAIVTTFYGAGHQWQPVAFVWITVLLTEAFLLFRHFLGPYDDHDPPNNHDP